VVLAGADDEDLLIEASRPALNGEI